MCGQAMRAILCWDYWRGRVGSWTGTGWEKDTGLLESWNDPWPSPPTHTHTHTHTLTHTHIRSLSLPPPYSLTYASSRRLGSPKFTSSLWWPSAP